MESSKMYCPSRCRHGTYLCVEGMYPVSWGVGQDPELDMGNFGFTNPHGTAFAPKQWLYEKEATGMEISKLYRPSRCRYRTYHCGEAKYPASWGVVQGAELKYAKLRPYQSPWYRVCRKAIVISKGSYGHEESKNKLPQQVQIPYLPLRGRKWGVVYGPPRLMGGSIRPRMEICETSALPIPMVPRFHQSNGYIKRKLRAWRVQIVLPQSVQIPYLPVGGSKVPHFMEGSEGTRMEICETSALQIPLVLCLHQSNGYIKRKLRAWRVQKCIVLVGAETNGNITYHCVAAKYLVSWGVVQGTEWKYAKLRPYQSPWYHVCAKAMVISKGSYGHGQSKNVLSQSLQIPYLPLRGSKVPRFMGGNIGPRMKICENSALLIPMVPRLQ